MDDHSNIYKKPDDEKNREPLPLTEMTPEEIRGQVRRRTWGFVGLMLVLLGIAVVFIYFQEEKQSEKLEEIKPLSLISTQDSFNTTMMSPQLEAFSLPEDLSASPDAVNVSPEKITEAMGEVRIANEYLQAREYEAAEEHARKALAVWPKMNSALRLLGLVYLYRGQFDQAITAMEKALEVDPFNPETYNNLATAYMQKRLMNKAEELLLTSLQLRPNYSVANLNLGLLYILWGRFEQAKDHLEEALEEIPENSSALNNMGVALIRLGEYEEARKCFLKLIDQSPDSAAAYFNVAITYVMERKFPDAVEWIKKGANYCSPSVFQQYIADTDFDALRSFPEFKNAFGESYPDVPAAPEG